MKIAPSILSCDFGRLNEEIRTIESYCDRIHVDVMDGHFVPNITIGPPVVKMIHSKKPLECHLMIEEPERYVEAFAKAGTSIIIIHQETCPHLHRNIQQIKDLGLKAGVALNPATSLSTIEDVLDVVDMVLLMTVNPGFGGQKFLKLVLSKIRELRVMKPHLDIEVDGGITDKTACLAKEAGANILVSGSYIFGLKNRKKAIESLLNV